MATYSNRICTPADRAPSVTNLYAKCQVCGWQWQVQSPHRDDAKVCPGCGVSRSGIVVLGERPDYGGMVADE
jgi:rubredoxin